MFCKKATGSIKRDHLVQHYHTSIVAQGTKNRSKLKKDFWHPRHRLVTDRLNFYNNGIREHDKNERLWANLDSRMLLPTYPLGGNLRELPDVVLETDYLKDRYYSLFPEERMQYIEERHRPSEKLWYSKPIERFIQSYQGLCTKGMNKIAAWKYCLREKRLEEEAVHIESELCKRQAQELFGIEEFDHMRNMQGIAPNQILAERFRIDPRDEETLQRLKRKKLEDVIQIHKKDPSKRLILLGDVELSYFELMDYINKHPETRPYFDESVYFGGLSEQTNPQELVSDPKEINEDNETINRIARKLPFIDQDRLHTPDNRFKNEMELEYLDKSMSEWALKMLSLFSDKTTEPKFDENFNVTEAGREAFIAALEKQELREKFQTLHDQHSNVSAFGTGADESIFKSDLQNPQVRSGLGSDLNSLFDSIRNKSLPK